MTSAIRLQLRLVASTAALLLTLAGPVSAGDQVAFRGRLEGTVTVTPLAPPVVRF